MLLCRTCMHAPIRILLSAVCSVAVFALPLIPDTLRVPLNAAEKIFVHAAGNGRKQLYAQAGRNADLLYTAEKGVRSVEFFCIRGKCFAVTDGVCVAKADIPPGADSLRIINVRKEKSAVRTLPSVYFYDDFTRGKGIQLQPESGKWQLGMARYYGRLENPFCLISQGRGRVLFGNSLWADFYVSVSLKCPQAPDRAGIRIGTAAFLLNSTSAVISGVRDGSRTVKLSLVPGRWYSIKLCVSPGSVTAGIDGHIIADCAADRFCRGKPGLVAETDNPESVAEWDDLRAVSVPVHLSESPGSWAVSHGRTYRHGNLDTAQVPSTSHWVGGACLWESRQGMHVNSTPFFNNPVITVKNVSQFPKLLCLGCDRMTPLMSGCRLVRGRDKIYTLFRNNVKIRRLPAITPAPGGTLEFGIKGHTVYVKMNGSVITSVTNREKLSGLYTGVKAGASPDFTGIQADSSAYYDYTFRHAPVDWAQAAGAWGMSSMWACAPSYIWYSSEAEWPERLNCIRWKRRVIDSFYINFSTATKMDGNQIPFYNYPWNVMLCLSRDRYDPFAGYVFLFGGPDLGLKVFKNCRLVRGHKPDEWGNGYSVRQSLSGIKKYLHEIWHTVSLRKTGPDMSVSVNGRNVFDFADSDFPEQAYMFFASLDTHSMLGRVRISLAQNGEKERPEARTCDVDALVTKAERIVYMDEPELLHSLDLLRGSEKEYVPPPEQKTWDRVWRKSFKEMYGFSYRGSGFKGGRVTGKQSGGMDGVQLFYRAPREGCIRAVKSGLGGLSEYVVTDRPFNVRDFPVLRFDYRIPPMTGIGLMIVAEKRTRFVDLERYNFPGSSSYYRRYNRNRLFNDGKWHTAYIDLSRYMRNSRKIIKVSLCDASWQDGVRGGWFEFDNWCLVPRLDPREKDGVKQGVVWKCEEKGEYDLIVGTQGDMKVRLPAFFRNNAEITEEPEHTPVSPIPVIRVIYPERLTHADFGGPDRYGHAGNRGGVICYAQAEEQALNGRALYVKKEPYVSWEKYTYLYRNGFSIDRYPLLTLRYKPVSMVFWLGCVIRNEGYGIFDKFNTKGTELKNDRRGLRADRQWHTETFDLRRSIGRYRNTPGDEMYIQQLFLAGSSVRGYYRLLYCIDFLDIYSPDTDTVKAVCNQVPGAVYWWKTDTQVTADPEKGGTRTDEPEKHITGLSPGTHYVHLRIRYPDGSEKTAHQPFITE